MIELQANLKALNLSNMARNLEASLRQAKENGIGYDEFLISMTGTELQTRAENSLNRRIRETKFPLVKPLEIFDLSAVPDLDIRLIRDLAGGDYITKTTQHGLSVTDKTMIFIRSPITKGES